MAKGINALFYVGALLGGLLATFFLIDAVLSRGSAMQQGAEATMALAAVLVPFIMGRAWAALRGLNGEMAPRARVGDKK